MKRVFLGLLVAGVALAGSAFTNAKSHSSKLATVYVIGQTGTPGVNLTYQYEEEPRTCSSSGNPCKLTSNGYDFQSSGSIAEADLNSAAVTIASTQSGY